MSFKDFDAILLKTSPQLMQTFSDDLQAVSSVGGKDQLGSLSSWLVEVETSLEDCHLRRFESHILYSSLLRRSPVNSETFFLGLSWSSGV